MVSSGAPIKSDDHTRDLVRFALVIRCKINLNFRITHLDNTRLRTRIGIASGPVSKCQPNIYYFKMSTLVSCIPSNLSPRLNLIGQCVTKAYQLEAECKENGIHCDAETFNYLRMG